MLSTTGSIVNTQCTSLLVFDYPANFKLAEEDDVKVYYVTALGAETLLVDETDYTINSISETGFNVELITSYDVGSISIRRETPQVQETEFRPGGDFPASAFEDTLDRLVMMQQEMEEILARAIVISRADDAVNLELPMADVRANRYQFFDEDGNITTRVGTIPASEEISAADIPIVDAGDNFTAEDVEAALAETADTLEVTDTAVALNTTHRGSDGKNHSDVVLNNTHRSSNGSDHGYIDQDLKTTATPSFKGVTVPVMHVQDQKTNGTHGGTFSSGAWRTRDLNTEVTNTIAGASLTSNQITLPAGTYKIIGSAPCFVVDKHAVKLYNISDTSDELIGPSGYARDATVAIGFVMGIVTITDSKVFELQHVCSSSRVTNGFGNAGNFGVIEIYADVFIEKTG